MRADVHATIASAIREGESHLMRLASSSAFLSRKQPFTLETLQQASDETILHLDQFVYRFTKLQDSMARRLLPSLYVILEDSQEPQPFLDILSRLEQLGVIESVASWQHLRNLRNHLSHDYPESMTQTATTINELLTSWAELRAMFEQAAGVYRARFSRRAP